MTVKGSHLWTVGLLRDLNAHMGMDGKTWRGVIRRNGLPDLNVVLYGWASVLVMNWL